MRVALKQNQTSALSFFYLNLPSTIALGCYLRQKEEGFRLSLLLSTNPESGRCCRTVECC